MVEFTKEELEEIHAACGDAAYNFHASMAFGSGVMLKSTSNQYARKIATLVGIVEKIWSELKEDECTE